MSEKELKRLVVMIEEDMWDMLNEEAHAPFETRSDVVRAAISEYFKK